MEDGGQVTGVPGEYLDTQEPGGVEYSGGTHASACASNCQLPIWALWPTRHATFLDYEYTRHKTPAGPHGSTGNRSEHWESLTPEHKLAR
eukprot:scaffold225543_cov31-Tisochrysis_lutea.AAC.1